MSVFRSLLASAFKRPAAPVLEPRLRLPLDRPRATPSRLRMIYRISDSSYPKVRFPYATKRSCLANFLRVFEPAAEELLIIADNVGEETWAMVNSLHGNVRRTAIGHGAGSFRHAVFDIALREYADDEALYLIEDDYLHVPGSRTALLEGLAVADYVSLYDHSDKYMSREGGGPNPLVELGGELTRVCRTASSHWKQSNSTTMTVATTMKVLREDASTWEKFTRERHPHDFHIFMELARKPRSLLTPIPGMSTHCEPMWAAPGIDWEKVARETTA